jgi:hypothetical protein
MTVSRWNGGWGSDGSVTDSVDPSWKNSVPGCKGGGGQATPFISAYKARYSRDTLPELQ